MSQYELFLKFELRASHRLSVREEIHEHLWKVEARLGGNPQTSGSEGGMIKNLPEVRALLERDLAPLQGAYLNDCHFASVELREFPTCETLALHLSRAWKNRLEELKPSPNLSSISVELFELDGSSWGGAILRLS
jgi:6-pyruvoyl-tetrahydropterin synthase